MLYLVRSVPCFGEVAIDCVGEDCCAGSESGAESAGVSIFVARGKKPGPPAE